MRTSVTCLACNDQDAVENDTGMSDAEFFVSSIFRCSKCGARMSYGKLAPRLVSEPFLDGAGRGMIRVRVQNPITRADMHVIEIDPQYAAMHAKDLLTLVVQ